MGWRGRGRGGKEVSEEYLGDYPIMGRGRTKDGRNEGWTKGRTDGKKKDFVRKTKAMFNRSSSIAVPWDYVVHADRANNTE